MILSIVLLGGLLGMRHALEADHVAAVASLSTRARSTAEVVRVSAAWGIGHALTVVVLGSALIALGLTLSERLSRAFEIGVGLMLVALGVDVLRRLRRDRVHVHAHRHADGTMHVHAHRHEMDDRGAHPVEHRHDHTPVSRAVLVGGVHGLAGSAALILVSLQATRSASAAVGYLLAFGVGSVLGMVAFSVALSIPLRLSSGRFEGALHRLEAVLGCATIAIGAWVALRAGGF